MIIEWDVPITMDDGLVLRADVFRPDDTEPHPVLMTHGPYAKGLAFQDGYRGDVGQPGGRAPRRTGRLIEPVAELGDRRPGEVGARRVRGGAGGLPGRRSLTGLPRHLLATRNPGLLRVHRVGGVQPWSNGKVGLLGISYYGMNQWQVAALQPPHLAAICPWEGAADFYREMTTTAAS